MTSFSAVQGRLLSKLAPSTMSSAAWGMSAVASTTAGGLPAPAPMAFFPLDRTDRTMPGPPVATSRRTAGWAIIAFVFSIEGLSTVVMRFAGAPASARAALMRRMSQWVIRVARGWGLKTTALPAASMPIELLMTVSVGFVVGVIAPMTPKGENSMVVRPSSPLQASVTMSSTPGVSRAAARFLRHLSRAAPMPVSSTAASDMRRSAASSEQTSRIVWT